MKLTINNIYKTNCLIKFVFGISFYKLDFSSRISLHYNFICIICVKRCIIRPDLGKMLEHGCLGLIHIYHSVNTIKWRGILTAKMKVAIKFLKLVQATRIIGNTRWCLIAISVQPLLVIQRHGCVLMNQFRQLYLRVSDTRVYILKVCIGAFLT